jgi:hypothetical protein
LLESAMVEELELPIEDSSPATEEALDTETTVTE